MDWKTPGIYPQEVVLPPPAVLLTGVPALLGFTQPEATVPPESPQRLTHWEQFVALFGTPLATGYLADAVHGFFLNGGRLCYVARLNATLLPQQALDAGLQGLETLEHIDLICAPDIMLPPDAQGLDVEQVQAMQAAVLAHCDRLGTRFALLDTLPGASVDQVLQQRQGLQGTNSALYFPWIIVADAGEQQRVVPPCGHIAGIYARSDQRLGVHKAPANELLEGVLDLSVAVTTAQQDLLNPAGVNCLRAFPGRGIRVWGARTVSGESAWMYVNVRRLFLTASRWIERNLANVVFEPHDTRLWIRIERELTTYCNDLLQRGALRGRTASEAFYIKCDAETNPPEMREAGQVVAEIGLAPTLPNEFVIVRLIHGASGVTISGPTQPGAPA